MLLNDRDQIIAMTAEWTGERYPNGRPRVSDEKIEILKNLTQEEIWQPLYSCGYRFQFQGDLKPLHPDKKLYGRAVTCCFMPQRPDLRQHVFNVARSRGWKGDCNQWVIDSLEENDVVVCDLYDKILRGTFVGGNLTTAVKARTKNGGVVVWGGVRDLEQMQNIDVQVFYRGVDPTPIRDCQITAFNGPCRIGAAICLPGDIVIGTKNGILFVPSHMVDYVIEHAYKSQVRDLYAFPKLEAGIYTTADVDAVVWNDQMMQALLNFIDTNPAAAKYRGLDWSVELRAAAGDEAAIDELYQQFDIERYGAPGQKQKRGADMRDISLYLSTIPDYNQMLAGKKCAHHHRCPRHWQKHCPAVCAPGGGRLFRRPQRRICAHHRKRIAAHPPRLPRLCGRPGQSRPDRSLCGCCRKGQRRL